MTDARTKELLTVAAIGLLVAWGTARAEDWPQFRGPGRRNATSESILVDRWPEGGPPLAWSAPVGSGNGTVVVQGERGCILGRLPIPDSKLNPRSHAREVLSCVDLSDGTILWQHTVHPQFRVLHSSPHTTPSIEGERVYLHSNLGHVVCVSASDGEELWRRNLVEELGVEVKKYGTTSSPLVGAGNVYVIAMTEKPERGNGVGVFAFDRLTGEDCWQRRFDIPGQTPHSSPVWGVVDGRPTVLCHLSEVVVGLEPGTGEILWKLDYIETFFPDGKRGRVYSSESWPLVTEDGLILDRIWNDVPSKECESRAAGSLGRVVAFRVQDGKPEIVWTNEDVSPYFLGMQPWDGYIYCLNNKHMSHSYQWAKDKLVCLETATGRLIWESRDWPIPGINEGVRGWERTADPTMTVAGGALIIADKPELVVVDCDPDECVRLAAFRRDLNRWSMPVVAGGRLYLRANGNPGELLCYEVETHHATPE